MTTTCLKCEICAWAVAAATAPGSNKHRAASLMKSSVKCGISRNCPRSDTDKLSSRTIQAWRPRFDFLMCFFKAQVENSDVFAARTTVSNSLFILRGPAIPTTYSRTTTPKSHPGATSFRSYRGYQRHHAIPPKPAHKGSTSVISDNQTEAL